MKSRILLATIAMGLATSAQAETRYDGFHVEAQGGWDHVGAKAKLDYDDSVFSYEAKGSRDGVAYGANVGYDTDLGGVLLGTEAGINWSSAKYCTAILGDDRGCIKPGREIEVGVRVGKQFGPNGPMIYGKVAYVNGQVKIGYRDADFDVRVHDNRSGVRLAAGIEQKLNRRVYVKAEYRYTDFKAYKLVEGDVSGKLDFDRNQVIGGVGLLF